MALAVDVDATLPRPSLGENLSRLSHVPFWARNETNEKLYETTFHQDFKPFAFSAKRAAIHQPSVANVEHKDLEHIREHETEMASSFMPHHLLPLRRIPAWTSLTTNLKMHSDQRFRDFHTTQAESFQPLPMQSAVPRPARLFSAGSMKQGDNQLPETTQRESYVLHKISPLVRADRKHRDTALAITGDRKRLFFSSSYNDAFQYRWASPPPATETQFHSSLVMGDMDKVSESETTHSASFQYTGPQRRVLLKKCLPVNLGHLKDNKWTTTTAEAFKAIKSERVLRQPGNVTLSSIPRGDMDAKRNQERSRATTNRFFFSEKDLPVRMDNPSIRTRSNVEFGRLDMAAMFYSTTAQDSYPHKYVTPVRPRVYPPGRVLGDQAPDPAVTTVQSDYVPLNSIKHILNPNHLHEIKASHIKPPYHEVHFTTTHNDAFPPKPKAEVSLDDPQRQHISHIQI